MKFKNLYFFFLLYNWKRKISYLHLFIFRTPHRIVTHRFVCKFMRQFSIYNKIGNSLLICCEWPKCHLDLQENKKNPLNSQTLNTQIKNL